MNNIAFNSLSSLSLFSEEIKDSFLFHIPHASKMIPDKTGFVLSEGKIEKELDLLTDHETDVIFDIPDMTKIIFPYSRLYCDVERLVDDLEPMFKKGRGFYYSKTDDGTELRAVDNKHKAKVFSSYYEPHHQKLTSIVSEKLEAIGFVHIIDCHSFSPVPLQTEEDQNPDRPDFCLGIDDFHTPQYLYLPLKNYLEGEGYSVAINRPYKGTIVPLSFYQNDKNVSSMMIEINQKLYVDNGKVNSLEVIRLQTLLKNYFSSLGT